MMFEFFFLNMQISHIARIINVTGALFTIAVGLLALFWDVFIYIPHLKYDLTEKCLSKKFLRLRVHLQEVHNGKNV